MPIKTDPAMKGLSVSTVQKADGHLYLDTDDQKKAYVII